ncbi:MAG: hypothetical protein QOJ92_364 [Frankiales bacterium]|nr:hypothetical protein [Frankiales bacterium]
MTPDDELRARLRGVDPAPPDTALDPSSSLWARQLLERAMTDTLTETPSAPKPGRSQLPLIAAAAAAVAALAVGAVVLASGDGSPAPKTAHKSTLALKAPAQAGGITTGSCIRFEVSILKDMSPAFAGTATSVGDGTVSFDVDHWYAGGTADVVTVTQPDASGPISIEGGVTFEQGKRYLVTAADGVVNGCGYTAEATPDMEAAFNQAFGG